jgi:hypothetical protein
LRVATFYELTGILAPFLYFPCVCIDKRNLLKARVVIASYNQHIGSFSPEPLVG